MASPRLRPEEAVTRPAFDPQRQMIGLAGAYESVRATLRERPDWSEAELLEQLHGLRHGVDDFIRALTVCRDATDQNLLRGRARTSASVRGYLALVGGIG